jgi:hypothetical protein
MPRYIIYATWERTGKVEVEAIDDTEAENIFWRDHIHDEPAETPYVDIYHIEEMDEE